MFSGHAVHFGRGVLHPRIFVSGLPTVRVHVPGSEVINGKPFALDSVIKVVAREVAREVKPHRHNSLARVCQPQQHRRKARRAYGAAAIGSDAVINVLACARVAVVHACNVPMVEEPFVVFPVPCFIVSITREVRCDLTVWSTEISLTVD
jgi:hypothetical protein